MTDGTAYRTIKALVLDFAHRHDGRVDYDRLTAEVRKHFPASKWKPSHWAWYRHQILRGRFRGGFSEAGLPRRSSRPGLDPMPLSRRRWPEGRRPATRRPNGWATRSSATSVS